MGILNVNEDSFFPGSRAGAIDIALELAEKHISEGAFFLDRGATSSRPGAGLSNPDDEWKQLEPVLKAVRKQFPEVYVSVDTYHSSVAAYSVSAGADMINDISAGKIDAGMIAEIVRLKVPYVLMHMQGIPSTMQKEPIYKNVVEEVLFDLASNCRDLYQQGISDVIIDPGFGFGKTTAHNFMLLKHLNEFKSLKCPLMAGLSRKSPVTKTLNIAPEEALNGTTVLNVLALKNGADILRVHDVKPAMEAITLLKAYKELN